MSDDMRAAARVSMESKNLAVGVILTLVFGGLGMLYTSIFWGLVGLTIEVVVWIIAIFTFGLGAFLIVPWHVLAVIITIVSINNHNRRLLNSLK